MYLDLITKTNGTMVNANVTLTFLTLRCAHSDRLDV